MSTTEEKIAADELVVSHGSDDDSSIVVDKAWKFVDKHRDAHDEAQAVNLVALRRKIDWHIVPLMFLCYTMQFLDKVILNASLTLLHRGQACRTDAHLLCSMPT
jgi:hypothetical protein